MRVLVTGASGFIGARVVRALADNGHEVAALVEPGDTMRRLATLGRPLSRIGGTLGTLEACRPALEAFAPEGCIHLAWYAEPGKYLHSEKNFECLSGSLALLHTLRHAGCNRVVMAGTCAEYSIGEHLLREDGPTKPETLYAASKLSLALLGQQFAALHGLSFAWGRIFYLYGPAEDPRRAIPAVARAMVAGLDFDASEGLQVRDYLHVDDVASGFVTLLEKGESGIFNVSSARPSTMREIMQMIESSAGTGARVRFGAVAPRGWDPPFVCGDNAKLRALGWSPAISLEEGMRAMVAEAREQRGEGRLAGAADGGH